WQSAIGNGRGARLAARDARGARSVVVVQLVFALGAGHLAAADLVALGGGLERQGVSACRVDRRKRHELLEVRALAGGAHRRRAGADQRLERLAAALARVFEDWHRWPLTQL